MTTPNDPTPEGVGPDAGGTSEPPPPPPPGPPPGGYGAPPPPPPGGYGAPPPPPPGGYGAPPPPPPPPPGYGAAPGYGAPAAPRTNSKAVASLVLGILGLCICGIILGLVAVFLGQQSKQEIAASGGTQTGAGIAQAGFVIGIIAAALGVVQIIWAFTGNYPGLG